jgi:hypothetical protein
MDGILAWTPGSVDKIYTIKGRSDFQQLDTEMVEENFLNRDDWEEYTWITVIHGTECNAII